MAKSALKARALGAASSLIPDTSFTEAALLTDLCLAVALSAQVHQAAARRIETPLMRTLFLQRSAARLEIAHVLEARRLALSGRPASGVVSGAVARPYDRATTDEAGVVDALERRDKSVRRALAEVLAAGGLSHSSEVLVRSVAEAITADHREVRDLNLILY